MEGLDRQRQLHGAQPDRPGAKHRRRDDRRGKRRPRPQDHRRRARRDPRAQEHRQHDGGPAVGVRRPGDPGCPRGGYGGQARWSGGGARCRWHVEGPDRQRQLHGVEPDRPGAQHRAGHDRGGERRPQPEDHRRRQGRGARAQEDRQHDGGPAVGVRGRGHARGARGRYRGQARRSGRGRGRVRNVERPDRQRQLHGLEPDLAGAQHRTGDDGRGRRATCPRRSRSTPAGRSSSSRTRSTRWSTSCGRSRPR